MKKIFFFLSAIALLGLTAACVEQQPVNPNYDAATNTVKTAFAINIMTEAQTKATAADVQAPVNGTATFLGMEGMTVYAFSSTDVPTGIPSSAEVYPLSNLSANEITAEKSSKIYNLAIKTGTNNMVFYGHAPAGYGQLSQSQSGFNWSLVSILSQTETSDKSFTSISTLIAGALNNIIIDDWKAVYEASTTTEPPQGINDFQTLIDLYKSLLTLNTVSGYAEVRQGSGKAVCSMVEDLYNNLNLYQGMASVTEVTIGNKTLKPKTLAQDILAAINSNFSVSTNNSTGAVTVTFNNADKDNFPTNLGLPAGAAQLTVNNGAFAYIGPNTFDDPLANGSTTATATNVTDFMYPASLYYWVSSPVRVSESESITVDSYPKTVTDWETDGKWTNGSWTKNSAVTANTRGVALQYNIQYATALLESKVVYNDVTILYDNQSNFITPKPYEGQGEQPAEYGNQEITVDGNSFAFKGIIIGGQPATVGWNWIAPAAGTKMVYDVTTDAQQPIGSTTPLYTLLFDNLKLASNSPAETQDVVPVAIELENKTGKDFFGRNNMIPAGGTFYLVGKLELSNATGTPSFASADVSRAPYLTGNGTPRVFMQDYKTVATFKIGASSLKNAYSTIPDLRSTMLTFGISVDLVWKEGYTFTVDL